MSPFCCVLAHLFFISYFFFSLNDASYYSQLFFSFLFLVVNFYSPIPPFFSQQYPTPLFPLQNPLTIFFSYLLRSRDFFFYICLTYFIFTSLSFSFSSILIPTKTFTLHIFSHNQFDTPPGFVIPPQFLSINICRNSQKCITFPLLSLFPPPPDILVSLFHFKLFVFPST